MTTFKPLWIPLCCCLCLVGNVGFSASPQSYFGLHFENDAVAETDRYYTHATRLDYQFPVNADPYGLRWVRHLLPDGRNRDVVVGLYLSQLAFTPLDIETENPPLWDRPYAGWLHLGLGASAITQNRLADTLSLNIGLIGPNSGASRLQAAVHEVIGSPDPQGWETQLPNEGAVDLLLERRWKLNPPSSHGFDWDWLPYVGGNVGTVFALLRAGVTVRAGFNVPNDFGFGMLSPSKIQGLDPAVRPPRWGVHVFATAEGRYVYHNIFLDGSLFRETRSVDKNPLVGDLVLGAQATLFRDLVVTTAYVIRTEEFKAQDGSQQFGLLSLGYWF